MSIPNLFHKIKSKTSIDKASIVFLFVVVAVGIGSFGLGRMSSSGVLEKDNIQDITIVEKDISPNLITNSEESKYQNSQLEKRYVASKNGKMYYSVGCSGVSRIKEENKIWFSTKEDAEKSGFTKSSTCKF